MATEVIQKIERLGANLASHPGILGLVSLTGAFNVAEWGAIASEKPDVANRIALEQLKDMALVAEGARAGGGIGLQKMVLGTESIDSDKLKQVESDRIHTPVHTLLVDISFARDVSSFLQFGRPFDELEAEDRETALGFGIVTDLGHFSRIMQKDAVATDVHKHWLIGQISQAFERNLNAAFTHRGQDDWLYPIPQGAQVEGSTMPIETSASGEITMIAGERKNAPNVTFGLAIKNSDNFIPVEVAMSEGRGEIRSDTISNPSDLLVYLSHQFESLLTKYPLEKAVFIFDKFVDKLGIGARGIQLTAVQAIKDETGKGRAKIIQVGDIDVAVIREQDITGSADLVREIQSKITDDRLYEIAAQLGLVGSTENERPPYSQKKRQTLIGKTLGELRAKKLAISPMSQEKDGDGLGGIEQAKHRVSEIEVDSDDSFVLLPPAIGAAVPGVVQEFKTIADVRSFLSGFNGQKASMSFPRFKFLTQETQIFKQIEWAPEMILPQLADFTGYIKALKEQFGEVDIHFQFAHIHPTGPTHTRIQEIGAKIAGAVGEEVRRLGAKTRGSSLVDEYHTDDLMADYSIFEAMLRANAGETFTELFYESSPVMRLIADAVARITIQDPRITRVGDTVSLPTDDNRMIEIWDNVTEAPDRSVSVGRQACVPFNIGMDLAMMAPELADASYRRYIELRHPQSMMAQLARENPHLSIHEIFTQFVMAEKNVQARSAHRHHILDEADRASFTEIEHLDGSIASYDLLALYKIYQHIHEGLQSKKRIPLVVHVLETNYNAQQQKARIIWDKVGIAGVPVFRISFDPASGKIEVLTSPPPQEDKLGIFFNQSEVQQVLRDLREKFDAEVLNAEEIEE